MKNHINRKNTENEWKLGKGFHAIFSTTCLHSFLIQQRNGKFQEYSEEQNFQIIRFCDYDIQFKFVWVQINEFNCSFKCNQKIGFVWR